ncbi:uncharacterized protein LOC120494537 [Tachysurus ichikawai]
MVPSFIRSVEHSTENVKMTVIEICKVLVSGRTSNPRPVIMRFISRTARDFILKNSKNNEYLTSKGLRFKEDLTASDREAQNRLWPAVEKARKEGKNAYFNGARAFVDGKEIRFEEVQRNR